MKIRKSEIIVLCIVFLSFCISVYIYPQLPARVASHWDAQGQVNGYMPKFWGTFLMPVIALVLWVIFLVIPHIDPKKENIEKFRKYFNRFIVALFLFLLYLHGLTLYWNTGHSFHIIVYLTPAFAILFYIIGVLVSHAEMNWTIGIRTPWTLSSETVWKKTHLLTGKLFRASGVITLAGVLFPDFAIWFLLTSVLASAVASTVYSYFAYRKEHVAD